MTSTTTTVKLTLEVFEVPGKGKRLTIIGPYDYQYTMGAEEFKSGFTDFLDNIAIEHSKRIQELRTPNVSRVLEERAKDYGDLETNFKNIAGGWSQIFGVAVTPPQVALAMMWLKMARLLYTPDHADSILDTLGYFELYQKLIGVKK